MQKEFFWLHIKKSAGESTRKLLCPYYKEVDREKNPSCFIQANKEHYNDILNNYRVPLGEYQFRRVLFAKKFLYPGEWDELYSFAFAREPEDRVISMFFYLYWKDFGARKSIKNLFKKHVCHRKFVFNMAYAFDEFLDLIEIAHNSDSVFYPVNNHFTTHVAKMWDDITDSDGNVLLKDVTRLENYKEGVMRMFEECRLETKGLDFNRVINKGANKLAVSLTSEQKFKIRRLYEKDFEIYETAN